MRVLLTILALFSLTTLPASAAPFGPDEVDIPIMVSILGYEDHAMDPFLSRDGQFLFFNNRTQTGDQTDLHYARRMDDLMFEYMGRVDGANSGMLDGVASLDQSGNFYFVSQRAYDSTKNTLYQGEFRNGYVSNVRELQGDVARYEPIWANMDAEIGADGRFIYATETRWQLFGGGIQSSDIFVARRAGNGSFVRNHDFDSWFDTINTRDLEFAPALSTDELTLYFTRVSPNAARRQDPSAYGIWVATRASRYAPFGQPIQIESITGHAEGPTVSPDGCAIYFHKKVRNVFRIMRARHSSCAYN